MAMTGEFPDVELRVKECRIGDGVRIASGTVIVADELVLGDGAVVEEGCDLRSARIELAAGAQVGAGSRVLVADCVALGEGTRMDSGADVVCRELLVGAGTYIGSRWRVGAGATMEERSLVVVGDDCQIAPHVIFNATEPITIGSSVGISAEVAIITHGYHTGHTVRDGHAAIFDGVVVDDGVWLGFRTTVLPGVRIGSGTLVAATATVTASLPPGVLAAGVPAQVKRTLEPRAFNDVQRRQAVNTLIEDWIRRLAYKGLEASCDTDGVWSVTNGSGGPWRVRPAGPYGMLEVCVEGPSGVVVFDFGEPLGLRGELDAVTHDLRNFCRRRTWSFPYHRNSVGLMPERFARLLG
ncbi:hypothetical protein [Streptomyces sp. NBC_01538]|uniref:acyltransferase n=1 Tax=Streptomyces sp. NBC_01538 TaxID=2903897 RepID=UPI00386739B4